MATTADRLEFVRRIQPELDKDPRTIHLYDAIMLWDVMKGLAETLTQARELAREYQGSPGTERWLTGGDMVERLLYDRGPLRVAADTPKDAE